ncbi:MAG: glutathione synthetase [Bacteroidota bacterium]
MRKFRMLVLTDHTNHSAENSLYALVKAMNVHPSCLQLDVATRGNPSNDLFFKGQIAKDLFVNEVNEDFAFSANGLSFKRNIRLENLKTYDVIWLRMPPPLSSDFLDFLQQAFPQQLIINDPKGIQIAGSKEFLTRFPECCPPMKVCESIADIVHFKSRFPIVLKPFREYGGKGIVRIDGEQVWEENQQITFAEFIDKIRDTNIQYLGVKFLKNVSKGDKRIIVVNGKIMGASLRLPAQDSWLCNVAMGGSSNFTEADEDEMEIVRQINPPLSEMGIVMYGVDTLVGDDGKRILSEINTTSIGGLPQIAQLTGKPLLKEAADLIWSYIKEKSK